MSAPMSGDRHELRIGDAERERTQGLLRTHVGAGRLDLAEFESRLDAVWSARTRADLDAVVRDLPAPPVPMPPRPATVARRLPPPTLVAMWAPWALVGAISLVVWLATSVGTGSAQPFWPVWVIGPWGGMLLLATLTGRGSPCSAGRTSP
ncbi:DUF1707 domain-containing protein [Pseudonocardia sp. N23]|uniref:DUF1707 SHOCT-like domain-containing protein n=1 Tax=Pseudonocardia sp. N23 TaxID=1987376 RepID=UPI000BFB38E6|nr:DUF1707 domain-containing protein [Pseudonocardia sp. N23]GAY11233.1 hypothetical protein TOK_5740 [Pseudonocardia sp. N23]